MSALASLQVRPASASIVMMMACIGMLASALIVTTCSFGNSCL
ncbi:hypothetical protein OV079_29775 [Nannocystis pusilla]|uniref:Uncharacterized protein n=1 Tax=Nannocystis pusilla TaxID=889268 RepID=A0A9X3EU16_9BACT|nr:hypothetical protein [Nannocystis pusilla]MCY1009680.1 hypothetical protein [Nannocystis pusilla]